MQALPESADRRLALLIATSDYSDPAFTQLRAPGQDASELAEVLRDPRIGGFDVQVVLNMASGEVREKVEDFCADRHPDDQLLIYLSCHGVLDANGRLYYAAADTRRQRLAATAVAAAWLNERLEDCRARRQVLILDCCHSGAFARGAKGEADLALQQRFEPQGRGRVVLTASRNTEYSFEGNQASGSSLPSVFTHAIVKGLRTGEADRDKDGLITISDLYRYVYDSVRSVEPRQTPELWTYGGEGDLLIAHSVRGPVMGPASLPEDLRITLESPRPRVRAIGIAELAELLDGAGPVLALAVQQALRKAAEEDIPQVAELARVALTAPPAVASNQVQQALTERSHREEQANRETREQATKAAEDRTRPEDDARVPGPGDAQLQRSTERQSVMTEHAMEAPSQSQAAPQIFKTEALPVEAETSTPGTPKAGHSTNWLLSRTPRQCLLSLVFFLVFFVGSFVGINKAPPRSGLSYTMGWVIGASLIGALVSLGFFWRARRARRSPRYLGRY